jgi:rhamnosyltransferase
MTKICVLLSAYNGEEFIEQQLHSLSAQENVDVDILVRDDGSTDSTPQILNKWQKEGKLRWYGGKNLGWAMSFMHLICHAPEADYYALCDHDDIWMPNKMYEAVKQLEKMRGEKNLYCSNMNYYRDGKDEGLVKPEGLQFNIYTAMVKCITVGCTMVFSKALQQSIKDHPPVSVYAHDFWVYQVAISTGDVYYDPRSFILYRQHAHNQIGQKRTWQEVWKRRLKKLKDLPHQHEREDMARQLLACHAQEMNEENRKAVEEVAYYRDSIKNRSRLFFDKRYTMGRPSNDIFLRIRILIGKL